MKIAEAELAPAEEQFKATKFAGTVHALEIQRGEPAIARAKLSVDKANNRSRVVERYTKGKKIKELQTHVDSKPPWSRENG